MAKTTQKKSGLLPRKEEKKLQKEGLKTEHTHPKNKAFSKNEDPNGMADNTLSEMKKKLRKVPHKSSATEHDKDAYD